MYTGLEGGGGPGVISLSLYIYMRCLSLSGPCILFRVMVKDKRMIILYVIISCDQPLFTLYFSDFTIPFTLSLYRPFHLSLSLSLISPSLSLPLYISPSTFLSLSLLLSLLSLSFSLAYLMDVFVHVIIYVISINQ